MNITMEAVFEAGVFKPLTPVENLKEHDKVRLVVEPASLIDGQNLIDEQGRTESKLIRRLLAK